MNTRSIALTRLVTAAALAWSWLTVAPAGTAASLGISIALIVCLVLLAVGYRSRISAALAWVLAVLAAQLSDTELPLAVHGLAGLIGLLALLPAGAHASVDRAMDWLGPAARLSPAARIALVLQLALLWIVLADSSPTDMSTTLAIIALLATVSTLVPSVAWRWLTERANRTHGGRLRIYYDRDCGFCHKICRLFRTFLLLGDTPVAPAQSDPAVEALMREHDSWVVYDGDDRYELRWHAVLLMLRRSLLTRPLGRLLTRLGMGSCGDGLYGAIAASRGWFSRLTAFLLPLGRSPGPLAAPLNSLLWLWIALTLAGNVAAGMGAWSGLVSVLRAGGIVVVTG